MKGDVFFFIADERETLTAFEKLDFIYPVKYSALFELCTLLKRLHGEALHQRE